MKIEIINNNKLHNSKLNYFTQIIYNNFKNLASDTNINHTETEIFRVLKSPNSQVYLFLDNNKITAYLVGEIIKLNDGRSILYITYLYTSSKFRKLGLASKLIDTAQNIVNKNNLDGIMLTCDTENKQVYDFYLKKGFMPDLVLRRYTRHDVLFR